MNTSTENHPVLLDRILASSEAPQEPHQGVCERKERMRWEKLDWPHFFFISCLYLGWFMFNISLGVASTYSINNTVIMSWCPWMWYQYRALYLAMFLIWTIKAYERPLWLAAFCASHDVGGMKASMWYMYSIFTCLTDEVLILRTSDWFVGHSSVCGKTNNTIGDETIDAFREISLWINTASSLITYYSNYIAKKEKYEIRGKCILMLSLFTECYSRCDFFVITTEVQKAQRTVT